MSKFLPKPLVGIISLFLYTLNCATLPFLVHFIAVFKFLIPNKTWQDHCTRWMHYLPVLWGDVNRFIMRLTISTKFEIRGLENLPPKEWYLITANHRSWTDIIVLYRVFNRKIPIIKFFMKRELIRLPIIGTCCWLLDFPFMHRHTKEQIAKDPSLKGKDLETTRRYCERFKTIPQSIVSFVEGSRYTKARAKHQQSPYKNLLKPHAGGIAFILQAMNGQLHYFLNVTIAYSHKRATLWDFCCGRIKKIIVTVENIPITEEIIGDYLNDREFRIRFQRWLNELWEEKDDELTDLYKELRPHDKHL